MRVDEHECNEVPTSYLGFSVSVTRVPKSDKWNLEAYLGDELGMTETSFTVREIKFCPWCGEKLGEEA